MNGIAITANRSVAMNAARFGSDLRLRLRMLVGPPLLLEVLPLVIVFDVVAVWRCWRSLLSSTIVVVASCCGLLSLELEGFVFSVAVAGVMIVEGANQSASTPAVHKDPFLLLLRGG